MEAVKKDSWFAKLFLKEAKPFVEKRDVNWKRITQAAVAGIVILVIALLFMPSSKPKITNFHEKSTAGSAPPVPPADGSSDALAQGQQSRSTPRFFGDSGQDRSQSRGGSGGGSSNRNSSMIIARGGNDGRTSLPPGSRIEIRLIEKITVSAQPVPVIGIVERDVTQEDSLAIPQGAKVFGEASFDDNTERAQVSWKTIRLPDGRERPFPASRYLKMDKPELRVTSTPTQLRMQSDRRSPALLRPMLMVRCKEVPSVPIPVATTTV